MSLVANVCLEKTTYSFDSLFSYSVPETMTQTLQKGCRVLVPFGRSNTKRQGLVMELQDLPTDKLKPIFAQVDATPLINDELLWLMGVLKESTFCTYYDALKVLIPTGMGVKVEVNCSLNRTWQGDKAKLSPLQQQIVDYLDKKKGLGGYCQAGRRAWRGRQQSRHHRSDCRRCSVCSRICKRPCGQSFGNNGAPNPCR